MKNIKPVGYRFDDDDGSSLVAAVHDGYAGAIFTVEGSRQEAWIPTLEEWRAYSKKVEELFYSE